MTRLTSATAIGLILAATPALAEVTPKSVWENLNSYYERYGLTAQTGAVEEAGDTLTVRELVLNQKAEGSDMTIELGDVVFSATGDGAVRMDMSDEATVTVNVAPLPEAGADEASNPEAAPAEEAPDATSPDAAAEAEPTQPTRFVVTANTASENITIREDGTAMVYDYLLPKLDMTITQIEMDNGDVIENPIKATVSNLKGSDRVEGPDHKQIQQSATADDVTIDIDVVDADEGETGKGQIVIAGLAVNSDITAPAGIGMDGALNDLLAAGMVMKGDMKFASVTGNLDIATKDAEGQPRDVSLKIDSADAALNFAMDQERLSYAGNGGAGNFEAMVPDVPVPVGYAVTGSAFSVDLPIKAAEAPQDFAATYRLDGLSLSDGVWSMFDPQNALPRDPASIDLDVGGSLKVVRDFLDVAEMTGAEKLGDPNLPETEREAILAEMGAPPADLRGLIINKAALSVLGATADVTGKLDAPEQGDMQTPVGTISGKFQGVNGLLDKLGAAGLIPAEQMMGVRMMLTMFAKPDPQNPEVMTTELEFKEDGQIFANGQRVK